ncbi:MAG: alpha/beta hydrolase, partial [Chlorobi bacterium]|nr:alpha/beta hydrolase [Chlorobiota bacterium]
MKLFYREFGEGKPLIFIHGLFGMSDNLIPVAEVLSKNFK